MQHSNSTSNQDNSSSITELECTRDLLLAWLSYYEEAVRYRHGEGELAAIRTEARGNLSRILREYKADPIAWDRAFARFVEEEKRHLG